MSMRDPRELRHEATSAAARGDVGAALGALEAMFTSDPTSATAGFVLRTFASMRAAMPFVATLRVFVLRSFTIEPLVPLARAEAALRGVDLQFELGELGVHASAMLDGASRLYGSRPDVAILALRTRELVPEFDARFHDLTPDAIERAIESATSELDGHLAAFRAHSTARLLVHGAEAPFDVGLGVDDAASAPRRAYRRLASRLDDVLARHRDVHLVDVETALATVGYERARDEVRAATMMLPYRAEACLELARAWVRKLVPMTTRAAKCVVTDLDHTLWGGVLGEDGIAGIAIGPEHPGVHHRRYQRVLLDLARRGILLAVASKNDAADAFAAIDGLDGMLVRTRDFAASEVHWGEKAESLRAIAARLGVGVDSLLFVDDNPVERAAVREALPMVHVLELGSDVSTYAHALAMHPAVQRLSLSDEDRTRGAIVAADSARQALARGTTNLDEFRRSLAMRVEWSPVTDATLARAAQLTQKTNQFNVTTIRRTESELRALVAAPDHLVRIARVVDRYGDNGLVGLVIGVLEGDRVRIDTLLMSCRVIGRTVESAMLALLAEDAERAGATTLVGEFRETAKNEPARDFFVRHGFSPVDGGGVEAPGTHRFVSPIARVPAPPPWFEVVRVAEDSR